VAGFKNNGLTDGSMVFWVPIVGPLVGGLIGGAMYDLVIRRLLPKVVV
jgi:glycerol uptake facilitator protein